MPVKPKKTAIQFDEPFEEITRFIHHIDYKLTHINKGTFNLNTYLQYWKINKNPILKIKKSYISEKSNHLVLSTELEHITLYRKIALYRKEKYEKNIPIYHIF